MDTPDRIEREVVIEAPVERVWTLVTEAEHLGTWFADAGAEIDLRPGGALMLRWREHGTATGRVERVEPQRLVAYRWLTEIDSTAEPDPSNSTLVEFTLAAEDDRTRLRLVESGFAGLDLPPERRRKQLEGNTEGWQVELGHLAEHATRTTA